MADIKKEMMERLEEEVAKQRKAEVERLQDASRAAQEALKGSISSIQEEVIGRSNMMAFRFVK